MVAAPAAFLRPMSLDHLAHASLIAAVTVTPMLACTGAAATDPSRAPAALGGSPPAASIAPPPAAPSTVSPAAVSAVPSAVSAAPPRGTLVVAGDPGVREVRFDGSVVRVLSRTPAWRPRLTPDGKEIFFYAREAGEIRRVARQGGAESRVAALPRQFKTCGKLPDHPTGHVFSVKDLGIHEDRDFVLDVPARAACLTLQDRNANMANVRIRVRVELATGGVSHRVEIGGDCAKPPASFPACAAPPADRGGAPGAPFPVASLGLPDTVREETVSPSGRWSVLAQPSDEGDYIHRALFLLDRQKKLVYPLVAGAFPKPLAPAQIKRLADAHEGTVDATGETAVWWLEADTIVVGGLLVTPERGGVQLDGEVAR